MAKAATIPPANTNSEPALTPLGTVPSDYIQIGEVAEKTGLTQRTLRYYEEVGLLAPPSRMAGGFRLYSPEDMARVEQVRQLKQVLGFSLAEIRIIVDAQEQLSQIRSQYRADPDAQHRRELLDNAEIIVRRQVQVLDQKVVQMQIMRADLVEKLHRYDTLRSQLPEPPGESHPS